MTFAARLKAGDPIVATFAMIASPIIVELLAKAGFDAVVLDTEHGPLGPESLNQLVPAARGASIEPLIRVRTSDPSLIGAALDVGASGVLVPQIDSAEAAAHAVAAARFGPGGRRGSNPYVRAAGFSATADWFARANAETAIMLMVEGAAGIAALPGILAVRGLDAIFIGPFDLAQALGVPGQVEHADVLARIEEIVAAANAASVATAVFASTPRLAQRWLSLGVRMVAVSFDTAMALDGFKRTREAVRA